MVEFQLVNPLIGGNLNTKFVSEKSLEAASQAYNTISQYFKKDLPSFNFTLKDNKNKFYHFNVKETLDGNKNEVSFKIKEFKVKTQGNKSFTNFKKNLTEFNDILSQSGGKRKKRRFNDDSSSDSDDIKYDYFDDDDDDYYYDPYFFPRKVSRSYYYSSPISHYWYWPSIYDYVLVDKHFKSPVYLPTFVDLLSPYVMINGIIP